jgi:hypothetical protein
MKVWRVTGAASFSLPMEEVVVAETREVAEEMAAEKFRSGNTVKVGGKEMPWAEVATEAVEERSIPLWGLVIWERHNDCEDSTHIFFGQTRGECVDKALSKLNAWVEEHETKDSMGSSTGVRCPIDGDSRSAMEILSDVGAIRSYLEKQDLNNSAMIWFPNDGGADWDYNHFGFRLAPAFAGANWGQVSGG